MSRRRLKFWKKKGGVRRRKIFPQPKDADVAGDRYALGGALGGDGLYEVVRPLASLWTERPVGGIQK